MAGSGPSFVDGYEVLAGRQIGVTRALSTLGRSQAAMLTAAGARVTLLDVPALENEGQDLMRDLTMSRYVAVDFNVAADAQRAAERLATGDPVDVLINNVAPEFTPPFRQLSIDDFELQLHNTCTAAFVMARAIATGMKPRGRGSIVNLCAVAHHGEWNGCVSYAASNGAIVGLTRSLARELGADGIRVNAISIGAVASRVEIRIFWRPSCRVRRLDSSKSMPEAPHPPERCRGSGHVDRSSMITGENLVIDGGW